jgi:hypothetical protein
MRCASALQINLAVFWLAIFRLELNPELWALRYGS